MRIKRKYRPRKPTRVDGIRALQQIANNLGVLARIETDKQTERYMEAEWAIHSAAQRDKDGIYHPISRPPTAYPVKDSDRVPSSERTDNDEAPRNTP